MADALRGVLEAAGLTGLDELAPQQQAIVASLARLYVHQADELLEAPGRSAGWTFTDPVILDGWGRGSMMVPPAIKAAHPDLADVTSFLDVGTGVGLLAVSADERVADGDRRRHRHLGPVARAGPCARRRGRPRRPDHSAQASPHRGR